MSFARETVFEIVTNKGSNQPAQLQKLDRILNFCMCSVLLLNGERQRRLSDCAEAQAGPRLCCSHAANDMIIEP